MGKINISQSLIKDVLITNGVESNDPRYCPRHLKFNHVDGIRTKDTDVQLYGRYFEWHLLGATRDGEEPIIPKIGVKNLKPSSSATVQVLTDYILSKGIVLEEKKSKKELLEIVKQLPDEFTAGEPSAQEKRLIELVRMAKEILQYMGLNVEEGEKQVFVRDGDETGHLDWVHKCVQEPDRMAIYDVKFTKTQEDDWRNGWGEPETKTDAIIQASHYTKILQPSLGYYPSFYFIVFGETGWIKFLRYQLLEEGLNRHILLTKDVKDVVRKFERDGWPAKPKFNRCLKCDYAEICEERQLLPEIQKILI